MCTLSINNYLVNSVYTDGDTAVRQNNSNNKLLWFLNIHFFPLSSASYCLQMDQEI